MAVAAVHREELASGDLVFPPAAQLLAFLEAKPERGGCLRDIHRRVVAAEDRQGHGQEEQGPYASPSCFLERFASPSSPSLSMVTWALITQVH